MDQPHTDDDKDIQESSAASMPQDTQVQDVSSDNPQDDSATQIPVSVQTDEPQQPTTEIDPSVMDGVPSSSGSDAVVDSVPSVADAEEEVEDALPQTTDAELAAVASELEEFANSGAVDAPTETDPSHDPMSQILQESPVSETESTSAGDASEASSEEAAITPSESATPTDTQEQESEVMTSDSTPEPHDESQQPVAGMETENELGPEMPEEAGEPEQPVGEFAPEVTEQAPMPSTEVTESQESPESTPSSEDAPQTDLPMSAPPAQEPSDTSDVDIMDTLNAQAASEEANGSSTGPATEEAVHTESASDAASSFEMTATQTSAAESTSTDEVVTPTAVAAAIAAGTAGDNAITGTPESNSVDNAQTQDTSASDKPAVPKQKTSKPIIVLVVLLVTLLFGGGAVAAYMMQPKDDVAEETTQESTDTTNKQSEESEDTDTSTATTGEKVEAKSLDDYKAVCSNGGMVTNATAYGGASPHPIIVFERGGDEKFAQSLVNFKDTSWSATASKLTAGQLVACVARKSGSEVKLKDCPITDSVTKVTADVAFHSTKYSVDVYEALTGKKVTSFENSSISTTCPTNAVYNKADPKIYAGFDQVALETSLKDSVTKVF